MSNNGFDTKRFWIESLFILGFVTLLGALLGLTIGLLAYP